MVRELIHVVSATASVCSTVRLREHFAATRESSPNNRLAGKGGSDADVAHKCTLYLTDNDDIVGGGAGGDAAVFPYGGTFVEESIIELVFGNLRFVWAKQFQVDDCGITHDLIHILHRKWALPFTGMWQRMGLWCPLGAVGDLSCFKHGHGGQ